MDYLVFLVAGIVLGWVLRRRRTPEHKCKYPKPDCEVLNDYDI